MRASVLLLLLLFLLSACGALPQPFFANPGRVGATLAEPPPARLVVPPPTDALLTDGAAAAWSTATADALQAREIPAAAVPAGRQREWTLVLTAEVRGANVQPHYAVRNPAGQAEGTADGPPVPARMWAAGDPATLKQQADGAAPAVVSLLNRLEAARIRSDPNSLANRPARVFLAGVTGAPGDGDTSLATQMRMRLATEGVVVQDTATGTDYQVRGEVTATPGPGGVLKLELLWVVTDAHGERGKILQVNQVPRQQIVPFWGDVAVAAAKEAGSAVKTVIDNALSSRLNPT